MNNQLAGRGQNRREKMSYPSKSFSGYYDVAIAAPFIYEVLCVRIFMTKYAALLK